MFRRIRSFVLIIIAAVAGAFLGRAFASMRQHDEFGLDERPSGFDPQRVRVRPQDLVPGVVAAMRVGEPPWSWLRIPGWLAAFAVNFTAAALGGDLGRLREMFEQGELGLGGFEGFRHADQGEPVVETTSYETTSYESAWDSEPPPPPAG